MPSPAGIRFTYGGLKIDPRCAALNADDAVLELLSFESLRQIETERFSPRKDLERQSRSQEEICLSANGLNLSPKSSVETMLLRGIPTSRPGASAL